MKNGMIRNWITGELWPSDQDFEKVDGASIPITESALQDALHPMLASRLQTAELSCVDFLRYLTLGGRIDFELPVDPAALITELGEHWFVTLNSQEYIQSRFTTAKRLRDSGELWPTSKPQGNKVPLVYVLVAPSERKIVNRLQELLIDQVVFACPHGPATEKKLYHSVPPSKPIREWIAQHVQIAEAFVVVFSAAGLCAPEIALGPECLIDRLLAQGERPVLGIEYSPCYWQQSRFKNVPMLNQEPLQGAEPSAWKKATDGILAALQLRRNAAA